jgi:Zn-dependent M28 family amino/carboxypeptidase
MTDWIGETFTSDIGWDHLESLVDIGDRMAGSDGERAGLELTRDALADAGARDARIEEFEIQGWERGDSEVRRGDEVVASGQNACVALPRSPSGEATGEFVDLGDGVPDDFERDLSGAVVMVSSDTPDSVDRFVHRREKYYHAVEAGAAAFVFANHVEGTLPPTGSVGTGDAPIGEIPAVGVSKETGARLARRREGEALTVAVDCETPDATSGTAVADLGPDTDEYLVVSCHVDAHDLAEGAMDNGAGTATMVEVANALAAREDELDTRVRFVGFGAEEVGLVGSSRFAANVDPDRVTAVVNVDSNVFGRTLRLDHHGFDALAAAGERVSDRFDHPI